MSDTLITVNNTDGQQEALPLDEDKMLNAIRTDLGKFMTSGDVFLAATGAAIPPGSEANIKLSFIVTTDDRGDKILTIGEAKKHSPIDPKDGVARWNLLNQEEQNAVFANIQIFRGLTLSPDLGFGKTYKDLYSWTAGYSPAANNPRVLTEIKYTYNFSKQTAELTRFGSDSGSVSMSAPFGSASANYSRETSSATYTGKVKEYLTARYLVRKVSLSVDQSAFVVNPDFLTAIKKVVQDQQNNPTVRGAVALVNTLNEWGWYVPQEFTLGGVLFATNSTEITEFSQSDSEKQKFGGSFKAAFDGIGGGASYEHASGSTSKTTSSSKYSDTTIEQSGGAAGTSNDYTKWAQSLDSAINWSLAAASGLRPSLLMLTSDDEGKHMLGICLNLLDNFVAFPAVTGTQPYLDLGAYATTIESAINPFSR